MLQKSGLLIAAAIAFGAGPADAILLTQTFSGSVTLSQGFATTDPYLGKPIEGYYVYDPTVPDDITDGDRQADVRGLYPNAVKSFFFEVLDSPGSSTSLFDSFVELSVPDINSEIQAFNDQQNFRGAYTDVYSAEIGTEVGNDTSILPGDLSYLLSTGTIPQDEPNDFLLNDEIRTPDNFGALDESVQTTFRYETFNYFISANITSFPAPVATEATPVPLPGTAWLLITGLGGIFGVRWFKGG